VLRGSISAPPRFARTQSDLRFYVAHAADGWADTLLHAVVTQYLLRGSGAQSFVRLSLQPPESVPFRSSGQVVTHC